MKPATFFPLVICLAPILSQAQTLWTPEGWSWDTTLDNMNQIHSYFPAVATENGKIYALGGVISGTTCTDKIEEYDIAADEWTELLYTLPQTMSGMAAVELDGAIYIIGGSKLWVNGPWISNVYRFFPETGFDTEPIDPLPSARGFMSACVTPDGKIYVIGGTDDSAPALKTVDVYDPATNKWTPGPSLHIARASHTSVVVGTKIYVMGGTLDWVTCTNSVEVLDLDNPGAGWLYDFDHFLFQTRGGHGSAVVFDNVIITLGGLESISSHAMSVEGFAPGDENDDWEFICNLTKSRRAFGCVSYHDTIYIMGGNTGSAGITTKTTHRLGLIINATREVTPNPLENPVTLLPNNPNPFSQSTGISFTVKKTADITISVFDATGQWISTPVSGRYGTGEYHIPFDGAGLEAGLYYCVLNSNNAPPSVQKWVVMRK